MKGGEMCSTHMGCKGCGLMWLIAGILFLLVDLNTWKFGGITPATVFFLLVGIHFMCGHMCYKK